MITKTVQETPPNATHWSRSATAAAVHRGSYTRVDDLETTIYDYLAQHNTKPKPFHWAKTAEDILARERRAPDKLDEFRGNR